jgi:hypothetical protein
VKFLHFVIDAMESVDTRLAVVNQRTDTSDPAEIGRRYLLLSWLSPSQADALVRGFTTVETHPLPRLE